MEPDFGQGDRGLGTDRGHVRVELEAPRRGEGRWREGGAHGRMHVVGSVADAERHVAMAAAAGRRLRAASWL